MFKTLGSALQGLLLRIAHSRGWTDGLYGLPARILAAIVAHPMYSEPDADGVLEALYFGDMATALQRAQRIHTLHPGKPARIFAGLVAMAAERYKEAARLLADADTLPELRLLLNCHAALKDVPAARACVARIRAINRWELYGVSLLDRIEGRLPHGVTREHPAEDWLRKGRLEVGFGKLMKGHELGPIGPVPRWDGSRVGHLVLTNRLGDGDALQFLRFAHTAAKRVDRLSLVVAPRLVTLFRGNGFEAFGLYGLPEALADADAQLDAILLPAVLGPTYGQAHYLHADRNHHFGPGFHVGVNWAASAASGRSVPPAMLAPLARMEATFHSLAYGCTCEPWMQPLSVGDYLDTAAKVAGLDIVVTVDTSLAHLAGALGKRVWLALPGPTFDWRWAQGDWYPMTRLFHGPSCFEDMAEALRGEL